MDKDFIFLLIYILYISFLCLIIILNWNKIIKKQPAFTILTMICVSIMDIYTFCLEKYENYYLELKFPIMSILGFISFVVFFYKGMSYYFHYIDKKNKLFNNHNT